MSDSEYNVLVLMTRAGTGVTKHRALSGVSNESALNSTAPLMFNKRQGLRSDVIVLRCFPWPSSPAVTLVSYPVERGQRLFVV